MTRVRRYLVFPHVERSARGARAAVAEGERRSAHLTAAIRHYVGTWDRGREIEHLATIGAISAVELVCTEGLARDLEALPEVALVTRG